MPFRANRGAKLSRRANGDILVVWQASRGLAAWQSSDEGLTWTLAVRTGGTTPGFGEGVSDTRACGAAVGNDIVAVAWPDGSWEMNRAAKGSTRWKPGRDWEWYSAANITSTCAGDGRRLWIIGVHESSGELTVSNMAPGESSFSFPRRVPSMPRTYSQYYFDTMSVAGSSLYGLEVRADPSQGLRIWRLR